MDVLTVPVLYALAALGSGTLIWQGTRGKNNGRKNLTRRATLTIIGAIAWPSAVTLGLLYALSPGSKAINWIVFGRTSLHNTL